MTINPLGIIALVISLVIGYFSLSSSQFFFSNGRGPIATGPGSSEIRNPQPISRITRLSGSGFPGVDQRASPSKPGESPFKGIVRITTVERSSQRPEREFAIIRHQGRSFFSFGQREDLVPTRIDVTGWRIATLRSSAVIPRAVNIPEIDAVEQDIVLPPGGELIVVTGQTPYPINFRENQCVGYFNQTHTFTPSLVDFCNDRPDRSNLITRGLNGECIETIESTLSCRTPAGPFQVGMIKSECLDFINQNLNYSGCVKNIRDSKNFLKDVWRVSLKLNQKLFDPRHDRITLRDQQGLLVDEFEY